MPPPERSTVTSHQTRVEDGRLALEDACNPRGGHVVHGDRQNAMSLPVSRDDLRGAVQASANAVLGVTDVVESAHATIARPWRKEGKTRGISRLVYRSIRAVTRGVARMLGITLAASPGGPVRPSPSRDAVVAILNGAFGDTLEAEGNPLAFPTTLRYQGEPFEPEDAASVLEGASDTMLLMVHGLCMHDGRWGDADHDMTAELARGLEATAIGVRYNSGRHVSQNGHDLADLMERLTASWPGLRRIVFVTHSMGGLVARSALEVARVAGQTWPDHEVDLVMLGTPHHGAPLERLGNVVDGLLGSNRFFKPYARLGKARSAGVTDLRFGSVHDDDWADRDRFERGPDDRHHVPLPDGVRSYIVAASPSGTQGLRDRTLGDGLVLLDSALGQHLDPERTLVVPQDRQWIAEGINHFDLVRHPAVTARVLEWLAPSRSSR